MHACSEFTPPAFGLGVGYDVQRVVMEGDKPVRMEPFLTGFLQGTTTGAARWTCW